MFTYNSCIYIKNIFSLFGKHRNFIVKYLHEDEKISLYNLLECMRIL